ncbi:6-aminohexanoate-cyclic-dimer hydrolase [Oceanobacillus iheyensis HTE831]|uniref:6-aminohexanoate-cyclic-dimer hydrolase n=1 Tax=Oceanobacillus iheyensis (strain DSM 14371 / CIP 107618 / JCM 11309 / KCTC 3954 / HTE831) TaxID=221109 RepID=Q8ESC9_OCEIH|nr:amidase family protein [Oceanobacillus iheyensis]BAC12667.1 6-aminohexanoate-cyclic-dimer hydrolase [Oceanobacillus iheyensis HTE831]
MNFNEYISHDAIGLAKLIKNKQVHANELINLAFNRLNEVNDELNIITHSREERVKKEALNEITIPNGMFQGVPILMKNISQAIEGEPMSSGSKLLKDVTYKHDNYFVKKFREAGFLFMGHTNTPEFGLKNITEPQLYGATHNPWNTLHSPGGSSGGAAAAIASGVVPLAGASDGGGSIRIPASFTGLFGIKPTRGRTPVGPGVGRQWQGASINFVLSRSVRDSAAMLDQLQVVEPHAAFQTPLFAGGYLNDIEKSPEKSLRIAYSTESPVGTPVSEDAKEAVNNLVQLLSNEGHDLEEVQAPIDGRQLMNDYYIMNSGEMNATILGIENMLNRKLTDDDMEIESWLLHRAGESVSAAAYSQSLSSWDLAAEKMAYFHQTYDFYITPSTAYSAPRVGELTMTKEKQEDYKECIEKASAREKQSIIYDMFLPSLTYTPFTQLANLTGQPAMSLPLYLTEQGLPLGVQVMANKGEEHRLLRFARYLEQSNLWVKVNENPYFNISN